MNKKISPFVSIGMTVFNGERFLEKSIRSLLEQDYTNFELIICDNHSDDSSKEICLKYEALDHRIKYNRNITNIGASANFNQAFFLSSGEYFMWAADHDLWDKSFISSCIDPMIADSLIALTYGLTLLIDEEDKPIEIMPDRLDTRNLNPVDRFNQVMWNTYICNPVYGLLRSSIAKKTGLISKNVGSDHVFLAELNLYGSFYQIERPLFYRRENRKTETEPVRIRRVAEYLNPGIKTLFPMIWTKLANKHIKVVKNSVLTNAEKEFLINQIIKFFEIGRFKNYLSLEIDQFIEECISIFVHGKFPPEFPLPKLLAVEAMQVISLLLPFESKRNEIQYILSLCQKVLNIEPIYNFSPKMIYNNDTKESIVVVIPTYNRGNYLPRAIDSVLKQTIHVDNIIIIDDASTDGTDSLVRSIKKEYPQIKYYKLEKNSGAQTARNIGIRNSASEWIGFLDSDDEWLPNRVEFALKKAKEKNIDVTHCKCFRKDPDKLMKRMNIPPLQGNIYIKMLEHPASTFPGLFLRRSCFDKIGMLDESIVAWQEWDTYIRLSKYYEFGFVNEPLFIWHWHSDETISKSLIKDAEGYYQIVEKFRDEIINHAGMQTLVYHYLILTDKFLRINKVDKLLEIKNKLERIKSEISAEIV